MNQSMRSPCSPAPCEHPLELGITHHNKNAYNIYLRQLLTIYLKDKFGLVAKGGTAFWKTHSQVLLLSPNRWSQELNSLASLML